jgi:hypothetical protein
MLLRMLGLQIMRLLLLMVMLVGALAATVKSASAVERLEDVEQIRSLNLQVIGFRVGRNRTAVGRLEDRAGDDMGPGLAVRASNCQSSKRKQQTT